MPRQNQTHISAGAKTFLYRAGVCLPEHGIVIDQAQQRYLPSPPSEQDCLAAASPAPALILAIKHAYQRDTHAISVVHRKRESSTSPEKATPSIAQHGSFNCRATEPVATSSN
jgi:hypothetical protein